MKFILFILVVVYLYILWDIIICDWNNLEIELDTEELDNDLYNGLHNQRDDVK